MAWLNTLKPAGRDLYLIENPRDILKKTFFKKYGIITLFLMFFYLLVILFLMFIPYFNLSLLEKLVNYKFFNLISCGEQFGRLEGDFENKNSINSQKIGIIFLSLSGFLHFYLVAPLYKQYALFIHYYTYQKKYHPQWGHRLAGHLKMLGTALSFFIPFSIYMYIPDAYCNKYIQPRYGIFGILSYNFILYCITISATSALFLIY